MLCLHKGAVRETRDALRGMRAPEPVGRWLPIGHGELADAAVERAGAAGLLLDTEEWGVSNDRNRLYGVLKFKPDAGFGLPAGMGPSLGLRSSYDKSVAINVCVGAKVFVCDNGVFSGDFSIRKLHTTGFRLRDELDGAFGRFKGAVSALGETVGRMKTRSLEDRDAKALLLDAFRAEVMPWSYLKDVQGEYFEPRHEEFKPRNAWSLYNAFTEVVKQRGPDDQVRTFRGLNALLAN